MADTILLSTAYFPPASYFALIAGAKKVLIERWENYHKQTYRNRCVILGANGPLVLTVPVQRGSFHKTPVRDIRMDDSRRWKDLHIRGLTSAYATAPYFEYYFDSIREVINRPHRFLLDLNEEALRVIMDATGLKTETAFTEEYINEGLLPDDYRYSLTPKNRVQEQETVIKPYLQVFSDRFGFVPGLSILDLLFNNGPGSALI